MTPEQARLEWLRFFQTLPLWHRVAVQELREKVLLQAIRDASECDFPSHIRSMLNQIELHLEIHPLPGRKNHEKI